MYCLTYLYTIGSVPVCNLCTKGSALPPEGMSVAKRTAVHSKIISKKEPTQDQRCVGSCYVCWPDRTRGQSLFVLVALINDVITETSFDSEVCIEITSFALTMRISWFAGMTTTKDSGLIYSVFIIFQSSF